MEKELIKIGAIIATRGLQGEVKVFPTTDFLEERFFKGAKVMLSQNGEVKHLVTIKSVTNQKNILNIKFKEITTIEEAEKYLRFDIVIKKEDAKLPKGFVFDKDLIGMKVVSEDGTFIGEVSEVLNYTSQKQLRIKREDAKDVLVPIVDFFIKETDVEKRQITINVIEGLL
jgi:16S rRNA processing protein RimM